MCGAFTAVTVTPRDALPCVVRFGVAANWRAARGYGSDRWTADGTGAG